MNKQEILYTRTKTKKIATNAMCNFWCFSLLYLLWRGDAIGRTSDLWSRGRGFDSRRSIAAW